MTSRGPIWLVRHASTEWTGRRWCGRSDPPLTEAGAAAASALAVELDAEVPAGAVVITSPLRRARETAGAIAGVLGAPVLVEPDLAEVDFGSADGLTWDELASIHPALADAILAGADPDWPEGELAADLQRRARSAAESVLALAGSGPVLVVSHGGLLPSIARELGMLRPPRLAPASALRLDRVPVA
jgi:broad specificity phosphatase PhoE